MIPFLANKLTEPLTNTMIETETKLKYNAVLIISSFTPAILIAINDTTKPTTKAKIII